MTAPTTLTRERVDRAEPLDFGRRAPAQAEPAATSQPQAERQAAIRIEITPGGVHIVAEYTGTLGSIPAAIERLRTAGVLDLVKASAPAPAPVSKVEKKAERVTPMYDGDGEACCPVHKRKLSDGAHGPFCSAKARPGQVADKKGYCGLRFVED